MNIIIHSQSGQLKSIPAFPDKFKCTTYILLWLCFEITSRLKKRDPGDSDMSTLFEIATLTYWQK